MKTIKKISLENLQGISRAEMKKIMAGSGSGNTCWYSRCGGSTSGVFGSLAECLALSFQCGGTYTCVNCS